MNSLKLRLANKSDASTIALFNKAMAYETENIVLVPEVILAGVNH